MKIALNIVGVVLVFFGAVWFLQGINVIHQGFMAGHPATHCGEPQAPRSLTVVDIADAAGELRRCA
jgi:hypothetical protein